MSGSVYKYTSLGVVIVIGILWVFVPVAHKDKKVAPPAQSDVMMPTVHTESHAAPVVEATPRPKPTPTPEIEIKPRIVEVEKPQGPMYVETVSIPEPPKSNLEAPSVTQEKPLAPYGRMLRCSTVNALVSSDRDDAPILGVVDEDFVWNQKNVIPRCSEVQGRTQLDYAKGSIGARGVWTIVIHDERYPGWCPQMVVTAEALDSENDPNFKSYEILNGSPGLHGMVIRADAWDDVKLFIATALSGAAGAIQPTTTTIFGTVAANPSGRGVGGASGALVTPLAQGAQAVLNQYAQTIQDAIKRDGIYVIVPPKKTFMLHILQDLYAPHLAGGDAERRQVLKRHLRDRKDEEEETSPRDVREAKEATASQDPLGSIQNAIPQSSPSADVHAAQAESDARRKAFESQVNAIKASEPTRP